MGSVCSVRAAIRRLRFPFESAEESSKSSVLANQAKGAVTMFFIVPSSDDFERARGLLEYGFRLCALCELEDDMGSIVKTEDNQRGPRHTLVTKCHKDTIDA